MTIATTSPTTVYQYVAEDLALVAKLFEAELQGPDCWPEVAELCDHLGRFRGKMLRPALLLLAARATGGVRPIHHGLAAVIEMFHLATLVHDDVLDDAGIRRNAPTINHQWGNAAAIMLGDWLISHAYHLCSKLDSQWASLEISATAHRVCQGELLQLVLAGRGELSLTVQQYLRIVSNKTAALTGLAARLGGHFNDVDPLVEQALLDYGTDLGICFQIIDDALDLVGDEQTVGKTLRSDLAEGKATLPLIHFFGVADDMHADRIRKLLNGHSPAGQAALAGGPADAARAAHAAHAAHAARAARLEEARRMIVDAGCIESARAVAAEYACSAKARLERLSPSQARDNLVCLADFAVTRSR